MDVKLGKVGIIENSVNKKYRKRVKERKKTIERLKELLGGELKDSKKSDPAELKETDPHYIKETAPELNISDEGQKQNSSADEEKIGSEAEEKKEPQEDPKQVEAESKEDQKDADEKESEEKATVKSKKKSKKKHKKHSKKQKDKKEVLPEEASEQLEKIKLKKCETPTKRVAPHNFLNNEEQEDLIPSIFQSERDEEEQEEVSTGKGIKTKSKKLLRTVSKKFKYKKSS